MNRFQELALIAVASSLFACTTRPRPAALNDARAVSQSSLQEQAKRLAPQAHAHAEKLRRDAEQAHRDEDSKAATAIAERAIAAYRAALVQARLVRATHRQNSARAALSKLQARLGALARQQGELETSARAAELKVKVIRDTEEKAQIKPSSPKREAARRAAARSISEAARLLCVSAAMLNSSTKVPRELLGQLDALEETLKRAPVPTPIDEAMTLRARCLAVLGQTRRARILAQPAEDPGDVLLSQLSLGLRESPPFRDDRGVVVTTHNTFERGGGLTPKGAANLQKMVEIAKANPKFPLLVVVHSARSSADQSKLRVTTLKTTLRKLGLSRARVHSAKHRLPITVRAIKGSKSKDERVEFVFVSP